MKKLLLASMIMIGVSGFAYAQSPEAVKAKKAAAKRNQSQPALTTASTAPDKAAVVKEKTDAEVAKEAKVAQAKVVDVKEVKTVHPNKAKRQQN